MRLARSRSPSAAPTLAKHVLLPDQLVEDPRPHPHRQRRVGSRPLGPERRSRPYRTAGRPLRRSMRESGEVSTEPPRCCRRRDLPRSPHPAVQSTDGYHRGETRSPVHPRVVQPGHRRARRHGPDDHAGPGPGRGRRRRPDPARLGRAAARRPRAAYMRRAADALLDDIDEIAELLVREQGKPRAEAYTMELLPTVDALHWCAKAGPKILADEKVRMTQAFTLSKKGHFSYEPIGVVGVIAPWNYPWSIPFGEVAIALMAGNGVVLKPASLTPLLGERIRRVFEKGGPARGPGPGRPRRRRRRRRARQVERRQGLLHRLGRGRPQGRRGLRRAAQGLGARARRQGPDDRLRRRRPRQRRSPAPSGAASPTPARPARGSSASTSSARSPTASSPASPARPRSCASATRSSGRPRSAR